MRLDVCIKEFFKGDWDDFDNAWDEVKKYVMTQYWTAH